MPTPHLPIRPLLLLTSLLSTLAIPLLWQSAPAAPSPVRPASPIRLPAALPAASGYATEDAFPGIKFNFPLAIASPPNEKDRLFIVEKNGTIQLLTNLSTKPQKTLFLDLPVILKSHNTGTLLTDSEWGLCGLAFHPDFARNGYFYIAYDFSSPDKDGSVKNYNRLSRFSISKANPNLADPDSESPLLTQLDRANNHNGGDLHFGTDGYLYYSMGDEGSANDNFNNASFIDKDFFAAIYRLDVDSKPTSLKPNPHTQNSQQFPSAIHPNTYKVPPDNPFVKAKSHHNKPLNLPRLRTEVYTCGLRNPWRFSFDPATNRMFIGDVGQNDWEEIHIATAGSDCGWPFIDGTRPGPRAREKPADSDASFTPPIYLYPHGNANDYTGNCVIGGVVYRGSRLTELFGAYLCSDFTNRHIWALREKDKKWTALLLANGPDIASFGIDPRDNDVLLCHFGGGRIERLKRTATSGELPPQLLSQTNAFKDLKSLTPSEGVIAYTPNLAFWSDNALKSRWFSLPTPDSQITFSDTGNYDFPKGAIFVKHFDLETRPGDPSSKRRLETRFLVKTTHSVYGLTYKWRPDNSDADLVPEAGLDEPIKITEPSGTRTQTWHYPARSECLSCHTEIAGNILGFNTPQLNGPLSATSKTNQLLALSTAGYLAGKIPDPKSLQAFAKPDDASASLDWRVRSYLAVNCVSCHQPGGPQSNWDARASSKNSALLAVKLQDTKSDPLNQLLAPGDPSHSMLLQRIKNPNPGHMPPLATSEPDKKSIDLLTQYIKSLR